MLHIIPSTKLTLLATTCIVVMLVSGPITAAQEAPAVLRASQILEPFLLAGPSHRVREIVPTDGYLARFTVDSEFGTFECVGMEQLRTLVSEVQAIQKLSEFSRSDLFAEGLKRSIEQPIDAVKNLVNKPVDTVKAVPSAVGHLFKKVGRSVSNAAASIKDKMNDGGDSGGVSEVGQQMSSAGKSIIGFDNARLECARQLQVDPYTDNPRLRDEMDKVTWIFFAGGLPLRIGAAAASGGASAALTATKVVGLPDEVYSLTPGELNLRNQQVLTTMQVSESVAKAFSDNKALSLTLRSSIIRSLTALHGASGRADVVTLASSCGTRQQARFMEQSLRMIAARQAHGAPRITEIRVAGRLLVVKDSTGALWLPAPVDYVSWTDEVAEFASRDDLTGLHPVLLLPGALSPLADKELAALGWSKQKP